MLTSQEMKEIVGKPIPYHKVNSLPKVTDMFSCKNEARNQQKRKPS